MEINQTKLTSTQLSTPTPTTKPKNFIKYIVASLVGITVIAAAIIAVVLTSQESQQPTSQTRSQAFNPPESTATPTLTPGSNQNIKDPFRATSGTSVVATDALGNSTADISTNQGDSYGSIQRLVTNTQINYTATFTPPPPTDGIYAIYVNRPAESPQRLGQLNPAGDSYTFAHTTKIEDTDSFASFADLPNQANLVFEPASGDTPTIIASGVFAKPQPITPPESL